MVYHTFLGQFQQSFSISGPGDGFKKRYAFLIVSLLKMILLHGRILRGFPFGNDIMPARSAAVDLCRISLTPRHRATVARWRGGK